MVHALEDFQKMWRLFDLSGGKLTVNFVSRKLQI